MGRKLGYMRVSTSGQDTALQRDALVAAGVEERDLYADVISGTKAAAGRPEWARLMEYAVDGDTVVIWRLDRLGRSLLDVLATVELLREKGIGLRSLQDGIDPDTSSGRLLLGLLATLAQYERELIVTRVRAGMEASKARGTRFGRPPLDPDVVTERLAMIEDARRRGRSVAEATAAVGWSRASYYRHLESSRAPEV